ncbi:MAG: segregation/condensation protein A [Oscillospiraceae bacterium]|nr:segregation/condensation protein A [Oscillospiraceae bacterium]
MVKTKSEMADFEGPLALILQLLSRDRIEIRDIKISLILEQYLAYLDAMAELDLDIASEFVAMASHLTYIKTKMLLSGGEEVSELEQLMESLEELRRGDMYLQIKQAAELFSGMYTSGGAMMPGPPEYLPQEGYSYVHVSSDLFNALVGIISREVQLPVSPTAVETMYPRKVIHSIPEKISDILERLKRGGSMPVMELFYESQSRTELIAALIAVLELCRVGSVFLSGGESNITITYTGAGRDPDVAEYIEEAYG